MATKICEGCHQALEATPDNFYRYPSSPDGLYKKCKACYAADRKGTRTRKTEKRTGKVRTDTGYIADRQLLALWAAVQGSGDHPAHLMFLGPSGCGKTVAAEYLAGLAELPFTKIDAAAMTDPESWFGTREVVARDGVSVTTYRPSGFVSAIAQPGVVLIDEVNRVRDEHRNILLPLLDGTHQVTNPLTGEVVRKHPRCLVIMSGNRGLQFTGTYAVDPALMTRSLVVNFEYLGADDEATVAQTRTGCSEEVAKSFVRFANETRVRAKANPDFIPVSTREVLAACSLVANGLSADDAAKVAIINGASDEGGPASVQTALDQIWAGIRPGALPCAFCGMTGDHAADCRAGDLPY